MRIAIIGSGSGSFAAAIQAASKGAEVYIIEMSALGGTCVNTGCIPSKILIRAAEAAHNQSNHPFSGLSKSTITLDRRALSMQQQNRVNELQNAKYEKILEANERIHLIRGFASFKDPHTLIIEKSDASIEELPADRILIATGSSPLIPDISGLKNTPYWTSTEALQTETHPKSLAVIGGSVIALELAQAYARLGTKVTVLARSTLLSKDDNDIGSKLKTILEEDGLTILTHTIPAAVSHDLSGFHLTIPNKPILTVDRVLVAAGRHANTSHLNLIAAGVNVDRLGNVIVDDEMRTNVSHIYAAGDCTAQPQHVYVAAAAGTRAATNMLGGHAKLDLTIMPAVVFTDPQIATVGVTEAQALKLGLEAESRLLTLDSVPRSLSSFDTRGFIKLVAEKNSGKILGAQLLAHESSEIIQTIAVAMKSHMTIKELSQMLFPYLTMAEGLKLCAQSFVQNVNELSCCAATIVDDNEIEFVTKPEISDDAGTEPSCCIRKIADDHDINSRVNEKSQVNGDCCAVQLSPAGNSSISPSIVDTIKSNPVTSTLLAAGLFAVGAFAIQRQSDSIQSFFRPNA